jgi:acyl-CoA synthetase (AMP-forming)/AMP-acid ligase II
LSCWKVAFNGAEPVRGPTLDRFAEAFASTGFRRQAFAACYGLAEATLFVSGRRSQPLPVRRRVAGETEVGQTVRELADSESGHLLVSSGQSEPEQRVVIVHPDTHRRAAADEVGEIWVQSGSVAGGYWNRHDATAETFSAHLADSGEGPFLRTGDLGFLDGGELFVTGRLKDLIIIRGRNLYPQDIELTVERSHPALRAGCGAAFSIELGEEERLVVVQEHERTAGDSPLEPDRIEAIAEAVRRAVAEQHEAQVQQLVLLRAGTIPKTSSGKIQRRACRAALLAGKLEVLGASVLGGAPPAPAAAAVAST